MKRKLGNVSFGGNWSEDILTADQLTTVFDTLDMVAAQCGDEDMRNISLGGALAYVSEHIEKGEMLAEALRNALEIASPLPRQKAVLRVVVLIRKSVCEQGK
ncbi:hypothetical protein [Celeribacter sp.]|uniref:hypothetical protein n=1 Tax=Celeribacter sp. TaxID=1890673 RepID=UPI003A8DF23A